jgi:hypothetical protein
MAKSTPTSPCVIHQPDEKRRLEGCNAALEKQFKELKAKVRELEAALERNAKTTV